MVSPVTRNELKYAFTGLISESSIQKVDDDWEVVGKWVRIARIGPCWDVWLIATPKKLNILLSNLPFKFNVLDGEAWLRIEEIAPVLPYLSVLGVRKRRSGGNVGNLVRRDV